MPKKKRGNDSIGFSGLVAWKDASSQKKHALFVLTSVQMHLNLGEITSLRLQQKSEMDRWGSYT